MTDLNWESVGAEVVHHLSALIRLNTTNPPGNEIIAAQYLAEVLKNEGLEPVVLENAPGRGNVVARLKGDGSAPPLLLYGHTDVVPVEPDSWTHDPFGGEVAGGYVWGRGALDMKAMVAMSLMSMLLLRRAGVRLKRDVIFAATADEEVHGEGIRFLVQQHPDLIRSEFGLTEFGGFNLDIGTHRAYPVQVAEKGAVWVKVKAKGKAGHASTPHSENAVLILASALARLGRRGMPYHLTDPVAGFIDGLADTAGGVQGAMLRGLKSPIFAPYVLRRLPEPGLRNMANAMLRNTATPTGLAAGKKTNVIPGVAEATIDCRTLPGFSTDAALAELEAALGEGFDFEVLIDSPSLQTSFKTPLFETIRQVVRRHDPQGRVIPYMLPAATDAKHTAPLGIRTYGFSPLQFPADLNFMELAHAHDERVPVAGLTWGLRVLYETIEAFAARGEGDQSTLSPLPDCACGTLSPPIPSPHWRPRMANASNRVVYIEDEPEMIDLVKLILSRRGYEVIGANGGREGLEAIQRDKPDLVLLDLMMPDMDGWEVYQQMKANEASRNIPVIVVTAKAQSIDKVLGLHIAKVEDYITKPFGPQELLESVEKILRRE